MTVEGAPEGDRSGLRPVADGLVVLGMIASLTGVFLPWARFAGSGDGMTAYNPLEGHLLSFYLIGLAGASVLAIVLIATVAYRSKLISLSLSALGLCCSVGLAFVGGRFAFSLSHTLSQLPSGGDAVLGPGPILLTVGGSVAVVGYLIGLVQRRFHL